MRDVSPSEVRAVALDLDGVILDGMQFHIDAWKQAFQHFGIQVDPMDLYLMEGMKTRDVVDSLCTKANLVL